jgi:IS5 family transposase
MQPGKRRALLEPTEGRRQDLNEAAKAHERAKIEHPFEEIKHQFRFQKTGLGVLAKKHCKINVLAALTYRFLARHHLLAQA